MMDEDKAGSVESALRLQSAMLYRRMIPRIGLAFPSRYGWIAFVAFNGNHAGKADVFLVRSRIAARFSVEPVHFLRGVDWAGVTIRQLCPDRNLARRKAQVADRHQNRGSLGNPEDPWGTWQERHGCSLRRLRPSAKGDRGD